MEDTRDGSGNGMVVHRSYISSRTAEKLRRLGNLRHWNKGQVIFCSSDIERAAVFVEEGAVKISLLGANGGEKIVGFAYPGTLLGETSLLLEAVKAPQVDIMATAVSKRVLAYHLPKDRFLGLLRSDSEFACELAIISSIKIRGLLAQLQMLAFSKSQAIVGKTLLALLDGFVIEDSTKVLTDVTQEELGHLTAQTRMTISRALHVLRQEGAIRVRRKRVSILNEERLRSISE